MSSGRLDAVKLIGVVDAGGNGFAAELTAGVLSFAGRRAGLIRRARGKTRDSLELLEALVRMEEDGCEYAVVELPEKAGEFSGLPFCQTVFTDVTPELSAGRLSATGTNILNLDCPGSDAAMRTAGGRTYTYSARSDAADLSARNIKLGPDFVSFCALTTGKLQKLRVGRPGMESVYGALAAAASAVNAGIGLEAVRAALTSLGDGAQNTLGGTLS